MILKVNDTTRFNLAMHLHINYDLAYIEITVTIQNKEKHTTQTKTFPAASFSDALRQFDAWERMFL